MTVANTGFGTLTLSVALAGTNPGSFQIASNTCDATLAAGASCVVGVAFAPTEHTWPQAPQSWMVVRSSSQPFPRSPSQLPKA